MDVTHQLRTQKYVVSFHERKQVTTHIQNQLHCDVTMAMGGKPEIERATSVPAI